MRMMGHKALGTVAAAAVLVSSTAFAARSVFTLRPHLRPPEVTEVRQGPPNSVDPLRASDPTAFWLDGLMFDTLTRIQHHQLTPDLASHWQSSDHGKLWRIELNPHAKWWNGRPISARDVVWSYRIKLQQFPAQNAALAHWGPKFTSKGNLSVIVTLNHPDPDFLSQFGSHGPVAWILPAFLLSRVKPKALLTTPYLNDPADMVGSGPYRLLRLSTKSAQLEANMHYFLGIARPRSILVRFSGNNALGE